MSLQQPRLLIFGASGAVAIGAVAILGWFMMFNGSSEGTTTILSVISGTVLVQDAGTDTPRAGVDGEELDEGDEVITEADSRAVITFFEGSTQTLEPNTRVTLENLGRTKGGGLLGDLRQSVGTTWNMVLDTGGPSEYEVASNAAVATVRDTMFQFFVALFGLTEVWSRQGTVDVSGGGAQQAAETGKIVTTEADGVPSLPQPAPLPEAELIITVEGAWLLLISPNGLASGCVPPGAPVNQIPLTRITECLAGQQEMSLIALADGTHLLYLSAPQASECTVDVAGLRLGEVICKLSHRQPGTGYLVAGRARAVGAERTACFLCAFFVRPERRSAAGQDRDHGGASAADRAGPALDPAQQRARRRDRAQRDSNQHRDRDTDAATDKHADAGFR